MHSMKVENQPDGTMIITARIPAQSPPIADFEVSGREAERRYMKWVVLVAAGLLWHRGTDIIEAATQLVHDLGPDSDSID